MEKIRLRARAKINLSIDIKGILNDGYHDVEMVMQSIDLSDYLFVRKTDDDFKLVCSNSYVPLDERNIIYKTWRLMKNEFNLAGNLNIFLEKNIPIAAGMAGGSADSAAMLIGINKLFNLELKNKELVEISKELGSDIAFCIEGGTCLATGRGTELKRLDDLDKGLRILICKPDYFVSTKKVYDKFDSMVNTNFEKNFSKGSIKRPDTSKVIEALKSNNIELLSYGVNNVLEPITKLWCKDINKIERYMLERGANISMMSGSGPTVFGLFDNYINIMKCSSDLRKIYSQTHVTYASNKGVEVCGNK